MGYPDDSEHADLNPCGWGSFAAVYFSSEAEFAWWYSNRKDGVWKTPNFEMALITIDSAIGCAAQCKENAECVAYEWDDPAWFTNEADDCMIDCKTQAMTCTLYGKPMKSDGSASCADELNVGPLWDSQQGKLFEGPDGNTDVFKFAGYQPDDEWKTKITDCPFGKKVVIEADASAGTLVPDAGTETTASP